MVNVQQRRPAQLVEADSARSDFVWGASRLHDSELLPEPRFAVRGDVWVLGLSPSLAAFALAAVPLVSADSCADGVDAAALAVPLLRGGAEVRGACPLSAASVAGFAWCPSFHADQLGGPPLCWGRRCGPLLFWVEYAPWRRCVGFILLLPWRGLNRG